MKQTTDIIFRQIITIGIILLLSSICFKTIGQTLQDDKALIRLDGCYIFNELWEDRVDSTAISFVLFANGKAAKISTPVDKNPFLRMDTISESERKRYYKGLDKGEYEIENDTLFLETKWYMYGILGGKNYNRYYFKVKNKNELIYLGSWTKKKREKYRILKPTSISETAYFFKLKEKPIFIKGR